MKRFRKSQKGFTLIELLIVIIIIGILAAIAIPMFLNQRDKAKVSSTKEAYHTILVGVQSYATDSSDIYPVDTATLKGVLVPSQIDVWPKNAFQGGDINTTAATAGNVLYTNTGSSGFTLVPYNKGDVPITM